VTCNGQCCHLAEISAAKHKSGPIKISAADETVAEFFRQRPNFSVELAEILCQKLATLAMADF
jgi:hypothetical protein